MRTAVALFIAFRGRADVCLKVRRSGGVSGSRTNAVGRPGRVIPPGTSKARNADIHELVRIWRTPLDTMRKYTVGTVIRGV